METFDTELQKAKDLIAKSEHIALLLPERPDTDCYAAAEAIARAYEAQGKHVGFLPSIAADAPKAPDACAKVLNPSPLTREFIIGIETTSIPIAQLRYEKHDDRIDVILSPKSSPISEDSLSFQEGKIQCECVIALAIPDIDALPPLTGVEPSFFTETPIVALGNTPEHKSYGEANLVSSEDTPLSQIAYALVAGQGAPKLDAETATVLLAGIIAATDSFNAAAQSTTHAIAAGLLAAGAQQARAGAIAHSEPFALRQLVARAGVRSKEDGEKGILWSFLTAEDFEKTNRTPADVPHVFRALARAFAPHRISILLWQDPRLKQVRASVLGEHSVLDAIASREPGAFQSPMLVLAADFNNFVDAEERLASLLREVL